jgi:3-hydroxybutyryl-CoA dehydrogenase
VERVAVIGAGLMGHGIAQVFAAAGHPVALHDPDPGALASAPARVAANLRDLGRDPEAAKLLILCASLEEAVAGTRFVTEAAPERLELKRAIFGELMRLTGPDVVLASNTSVIPIGSISEGLPAPERVVGTHWWNPPHLVELVEVIQADRTDPAVVERTLAVLRGVGRRPVHVRRDVPGFVGNRLQHALWREAIALVADGVCDAETVDFVVRAGFGRRLAVMGPLETADYVGLDLTLDIHEQILFDLDRTPGPSPLLRELVAEGRLGMKTGEGFRRWSPDSAGRARAALLAHLAPADADARSGEPATELGA